MNIDQIVTKLLQDNKKAANDAIYKNAYVDGVLDACNELRKQENRKGQEQDIST